MSGAGKKIVESIRRNIDWDGMSKLLVTENAKKEFAALRRAYDEVTRTLEAKLNVEPQPIDWEFYKKSLGAPLVNMYKEAYESIKIPEYVDKVTPEYKPKFDAIIQECKEAEKRSLEESASLEQEIAQIRELKNKLPTMTADDCFQMYPELKEKFDEELRNDNWGY
eukprot:TRINITY_DN3290_c0_g1_i1.p1 TRINITY_DN3290_c0_g1~~TRINITY_DN3290_c0_g1_i1.p1  ORF type:complete len:166 (+),score=33.87 TRINITY_DN3290_c0_g1_i1:168-665(+)